MENIRLSILAKRRRFGQSKKKQYLCTRFRKKSLFLYYLHKHYLSALKQDSNILWAQCQQILRDNLSQSAYQTWFAPILALDFNNDVLVLQVKSQFIVEYIEENYLDLL